MKKGWKTFWIVCLVTFCIGIGFCVAGYALGASWEMIGNYTPGWISFGTGAERQIAIGSTKKQEAPVDALEQHFTGINSIEVEAEMIQLQILTTEDNDGITVELENEGLFSKMECYKEGGKLVIETNDTFKLNGTAGTLWIYVPETKFKEMEIDVEAGSVYIEDAYAGRLSVNVEAGEAVIEQFLAEETELECGAGRIEARGDASRILEASCGAGEIDLDLHGEKEDYNYEIECGVGEVIIGNESHSGIGSTERHDHGSSKGMNIECGIGSVTVEFE